MITKLSFPFREKKTAWRCFYVEFRPEVQGVAAFEDDRKTPREFLDPHCEYL